MTESCYISMGCVTYDRGLGSLAAAAVLVAIILVVSDNFEAKCCSGFGSSQV